MARLVVLILMFVASAEPAFAYMGPGSGLAFVGSLFALLAAVAAGILGFVWYPVKRLIRAFRPERDADADGDQIEDQP